MTVSPDGPPKVEGKFLVLTMQLILAMGHKEANKNLKVTSLRTRSPDGAKQASKSGKPSIVLHSYDINEPQQ